MYQYPTASDFTAALPTFIGIVTGNNPGLATDLKALYVVAGFALSQVYPDPSTTLATPHSFPGVSRAFADPKINWGTILQTLLPIILQILSGLGNIPKTSG